MGKRFKKRFNNHQKKPYHKKPFQRPQNEEPSLNQDELKETQQIVKESLKEDQVGITEYVNRGEGFMGILKSRFSDFHVNEIDLNGEILHLTDLTIPVSEEKDMTPEEISSAKKDLTDVVTEDMWDQIQKLREEKLEKNKKLKEYKILFDVTNMNKEQRTKFHKVIGTMYKKKLASRTVKGKEAESLDSEKRFIAVFKHSGPGRNHWPFQKEVVHFLVHKENLDTSDVASTIAARLRLRPSLVNYCGTKDKRAKTTQKFCIKRRSPENIASAVKYVTGVTLGNFTFKGKHIKLGDLRGNRFRIAIRNLVGERQHIETSLKNVKEQGFINYFGFQRFGNCSSIPTYDVGVALLKADYKLACELILKPRDNDVPFLKKIREMWWKDRDSKAAADQFRSDRFIEKKLLDGLVQYGENDYAAALMKIPRNTLLLYPHAFQSLIFNNVASKRIKEFGLKVLPGDLVYIHKEELLNEARNKDLQDEDENKEDQEEHEDEKNEDEQGEERGSEQEEDNDERETDPENPSSTKNPERFKFRFIRQIKHLTEEEIANGTYTIHDVLLTLPGYDVLYPENVVGSYYKEFMDKYELSSENFNHKHKTFAMRGAYRKLATLPRDMSWEFKSYSAPDETLILSDLEILQGKTLEDFKTGTDEPKYEALLLDFCLPPAAYATMMLRELLKCDTSSAAQAVLQQAADKEHAEVDNVEKETQISEALGGKRKANDDENEEQSINSSKLLKDSE